MTVSPGALLSQRGIRSIVRIVHDAKLDHGLRRQRRFAAEVPFLVSTSGYGEYHPGAGTYHFDFADEERYRIQGPEIDYYFYYGPTPKQIFEEHHAAGVPSEMLPVAADRFGSWTSPSAEICVAE